MLPRKSRRVLVILVVVWVALWIGWARKSEPHYGGMSLSHWLKEFQSANHKEQAEEALRQIGPQAIPYLLARARAADSRFNGMIRESWEKLPEFLRKRLPKPRSKDEVLGEIGHALRAIGPPAMPELLIALEDENPDVRWAAAESAPYGNDPKLEVQWWTRVLETADYDHRQAAAMILGLKGTNAWSTVPALLNTMQHDPIDYVRATAAESLIRLDLRSVKEDPEATLAATLSDPIPKVRVCAAIALWRFNGNTNAVSVLIDEVLHPSGEEFMPVGAMLSVLGEAGTLAKPAIPGIMKHYLEAPLRGQWEGWMTWTQLAWKALQIIDPSTEREIQELVRRTISE